MKTPLDCIMERENNPQMIGEYVSLKTRMSAGDAHYAGELVEGAHIVTAWGDVGTELAIRLFGDESLFVGYSEVRYTAPVFAGDWMEYGGYIEKVGNTSFTCKFFAYKWMKDSKDENGNVIRFELFDIVEVDEQEYALLLPVDEEEDDEVVLMRLTKDGDEYLFETIDDDEEFDRVAEYVENMEDEDEDEE